MGSGSGVSNLEILDLVVSHRFASFPMCFTSMSVGVEGVAPSGRFVVFRHFLICSTVLLCVDSNIS